MHLYVTSGEAALHQYWISNLKEWLHESSTEYRCLTESWSWGCIYILFLSFLSYLLCCLVCLFAFVFGQPFIPQQTYFCCCSFFPSFISRYLYADPLHCNMTYLLLRLLKDDLKEYTYAARLAGLVYGIASGMNAILVSKRLKFEGKWVCPCWDLFEAFAECGNGLGFFLMLRLIMWSAVCPACLTWRILNLCLLLHPIQIYHLTVGLLNTVLWKYHAPTED